MGCAALRQSLPSGAHWQLCLDTTALCARLLLLLLQPITACRVTPPLQVVPSQVTPGVVRTNGGWPRGRMTAW